MEIFKTAKIYDFMGKKVPLLAVSTILVILSVVSLFTKGLNSIIQELKTLNASWLLLSFTLILLFKTANFFSSGLTSLFNFFPSSIIFFKSSIF